MSLLQIHCWHSQWMNFKNHSSKLREKYDGPVFTHSSQWLGFLRHSVHSLYIYTAKLETVTSSIIRRLSISQLYMFTHCNVWVCGKIDRTASREFVLQLIKMYADIIIWFWNLSSQEIWFQSLNFVIDLFMKLFKMNNLETGRQCRNVSCFWLPVLYKLLTELLNFSLYLFHISCNNSVCCC